MSLFMSNTFWAVRYLHMRMRWSLQLLVFQSQSDVETQHFWILFSQIQRKSTQARTLLIFGTSDKYLTVRAAQDSAPFVKDFRLELLEGVSLDCDTKKWLNVIIVFLQIHDSFWPIEYNWNKNSGEPLGATGSPWSCQQSNWRFLDQQKIKLKMLKPIGNDDCRPIPPCPKAELIQAEGVRFLLLFSPPYIRPITKYHIPRSRLKSSLFLILKILRIQPEIWPELKEI